MTPDDLKAIRKRNDDERSSLSHRYIEDCWYSCPKHAEYAGNDAGGDCNCAYAERQQRIADTDALLAEVERLRAFEPIQCRDCRWMFEYREQLEQHLVAGGGQCPGAPFHIRYCNGSAPGFICAKEDGHSGAHVPVRISR